MKNLTPNEQLLNLDIKRYKTNKLPANLALLGLVFGCLYFCLLYGFRGSFFSNWKIGISVLVTLVTLLTAFLASEGIKGYNKKYCITLIVLAAVQIIRIFILPLSALQHDVAVKAGEELALETRYFGVDLPYGACFAFLVIWLCASAACFIASAVIGYINCKKLADFEKQVESGEIVIENLLAEENAAEASAQSGEEVQ